METQDFDFWRRQLAFLSSADGEALLAGLGGELQPSPALIASLRRNHSPDLVSLALRVAEARRKVGAKFPQPERLFFTPELLEQASAWPVASYRAERFAGLGPVLDLGCGAGGDLIALAQAGGDCHGADREPLALALAEANLERLGLSAKLHLVDFPSDPLPDHAALFADPARREEGRSVAARRRLPPSAFSPAPPDLRRILRRNWAVKWGPGLDLSHLALTSGGAILEGMSPEDYELELISWRGELREAVLWGGDARSGKPRRATALHGTPESASVSSFSGMADRPPPLPEANPTWILEPDPALIRSGLLNEWAKEQGAGLLAPEIAYLGTKTAIRDPLCRAWPVLEGLPFSLRGLQAGLDRHDAGSIVLKKRGFPHAPEELRSRLRLRGHREVTVLIHRCDAGHQAWICGPPVRTI